MLRKREELSIQLEHVRVQAQIYGNPKSFPLLCLHGWLDNSSSYEGLAKHLDNLYLIALDFPGHGYSDHLPHGMRYNFSELAAVIYGCIRKLKLNHYGLMGHSMGAGAATLAAAVLGEPLKALILLDGIGPISQKPADAPDSMRKSILSFHRMAEKKMPIYQSRQRAITARMNAGNIDKESVVKLVKRGLEKTSDGYRWRSDPRLKVPSLHRFTEEQVIEFIKQIECPTLMLMAKNGFPGLYELAQHRAKHLQRLEYHDVNGGHHVHMDNPKPLANKIMAFVKKQSLI